MTGDASADKRREYNQMQIAKENEIGELRAEETTLSQAIDTFNTAMGQGLYELAESNQKLVEQGGLAAQKAITENEEITAAVNDLVEKYRETASEGYPKLRQKMEDEIENIQRKRDALPWD